MRVRSFTAVILLAAASLQLMSQQAPAVQVGKFLTFEELLSRQHIDLTFDSLVKALRHPDAHVRYLAALTLAEDQATAAVPAIIEALNAEPVPETRTNMALALAQLGEQRGFATLKGICADPGMAVELRIYATMYMLDLKGESCAKSILKVLQSSVGSGFRILALSQLSRFQHLSPVTLNV